MASNLTDRAQGTVNNGRDYASSALDTASKQVRKGSKTAATQIERGGKRASNVLKDASARADSQGHSGMRGYVGSHPFRFLLFAGLIAGVIAVFIVRRGIMSNDEDDDDFDD